MNRINIINVIINVTWDSLNGFKNLVEVLYQVNGQTQKMATANPKKINNTILEINEIDGRGGFVNGTITLTTGNDSLPIDLLVSYNNSDGTTINERYQLRRNYDKGSHLFKI